MWGTLFVRRVRLSFAFRSSGPHERLDALCQCVWWSRLAVCTVQRMFRSLAWRCSHEYTKIGRGREKGSEESRERSLSREERVRSRPPGLPNRRGCQDSKMTHARPLDGEKVASPEKEAERKTCQGEKDVQTNSGQQPAEIQSCQAQTGSRERPGAVPIGPPFSL